MNKTMYAAFAVATVSVIALALPGTALAADHLVNGNFEYPSLPHQGDAATTDNYLSVAKQQRMTTRPGTWRWVSQSLNQNSLGWYSSQPYVDEGDYKVWAGTVQINKQRNNGNQFGELAIHTTGSSVYQDISTTPGTVWHWNLSLASMYASHRDIMAVKIGSTSSQGETRAWRTSTNGGGDGTGYVGTRFGTKGTVDDGFQYESYKGGYRVPDNQSTTRFTFASIEAYAPQNGGQLDGISFSQAYKLMYNANGGTGNLSQPSYNESNDSTSQYYTAGQTATVSNSTPSRTNCTFIGWTTSAKGVAYNASQVASLGCVSTVKFGSGHITMYAAWANNPTLTYNANTTRSLKKGVPGSSRIAYNAKVTRETSWTNDPYSIVTGYKFDGWYDNSACTVAHNFNATLTQDTTVYAKWTPITYYVKYHANGGTGSDITQTCRYDSRYNVSGATGMSRTNWTFRNCWATTAGEHEKTPSGWKQFNVGENTIYNLCSTEGAVYHLYACWDPQVHYVVDGETNYAGYPGSGFSSNYDTVSYNTVDSYLANRKNWAVREKTRGFDGLSPWYANSAYTSEFNVNAKITSPTTVYIRNSVWYWFDTTTSSSINNPNYIFYVDEAHQNVLKADGSNLYILAGGKPAWASGQQWIWYGSQVHVPDTFRAYVTDVDPHILEPASFYLNRNATGTAWNPNTNHVLKENTCIFAHWPWVVYDGVASSW